MLGDVQNRFRVQQPDRQVQDKAPEENQPGRMGAFEVGRKPEANPGLQVQDGPRLSPPDEHWLDRVELVQGRKLSDIRNENAPGFVKIRAEGGPSVNVLAVDKPIDRMVDRDGLIRMIGHPPKPDRKLLGFIKIEGSPDYARALRRIDSFQRKMQEPVPDDPRARKAKLDEMHGLLRQARSALIAYAERHPENPSLRTTANKVIDRMSEEIGLLSSVKDEENQAFIRRHAVEGKPITWASAASLLAGAGEATMLNYDDSRLDPDRSRDGLGSGINGTVDLVAYDDGSQWIFKPDRLANPISGATAQHMGIDLSNPRQGDRIIGTSIVDAILSPPPREGDPEVPPRETRRAIHNGQVGVLVPVARGFSPQETAPGPIATEPFQIEMYRGATDSELAQMKVRRLLDVDVALSVEVAPENVPEDAPGLGTFELSRKYGLVRVDDGYRTETRPLLDERSRELAQRFGAEVEHREDVYQKTIGQTYRVDTHDPDLRRLLNIQECKDFVSGNHDRHPGNYKLERGEDGHLRLNAYDDDETFPEIFDEDVIREGYLVDGVRVRAGKEVGLPVVMDREFAEHLLTLRWEDFRTLDGTIPDRALGVAKARFDMLQEHARTLLDEGRVLDRNAEGDNQGEPVNQWADGNWISPNGESLHQMLSDPTTSYMGKLIDQTQYGTIDMPGLEPGNE